MPGGVVRRGAVETAPPAGQARLVGVWEVAEYVLRDGRTPTVGGSILFTERGWAVLFFVVDEEACTRCALCIDRCPTNVITLGKFAGSVSDTAIESGIIEAPWQVDTGQRDFKNGYVYGIRR